MRKFLIPAIISALVASTGLALAAEGREVSGSEVGIVKSWNAKSHSLTLADGHVYLLPSTYGRIDAFKAGEKVTVAFIRDGADIEATGATMF